MTSLRTSSSGAVQKQVVQDSYYYPTFIMDELKLDPTECFLQLQKFSFADRSAQHMKYRGTSLTRSKFFAVSNLQTEVPVYRFPGFQYKQVVQEYKLIDDFPLLKQLKEVIKSKFVVDTNHVIGTLYQDGKDSIGWHNDKPETIDPEVPIFIFSFGEKRPLLLKQNSGTDAEISVPMEAGSLFILGSKTNKDYQHCIAKDVNGTLGPRISLIFRNIINLIPRNVINKKAEKIPVVV